MNYYKYLNKRKQRNSIILNNFDIYTFFTNVSQKLNNQETINIKT